MNDNLGWLLNNNEATISGGGVRWQMDLACPVQGAKLEREGNELGSVFCLQGTDNVGPLDAYVRGSDLIVAYPSTEQAPVAGDVYWRCNEASSELLAIELIYSLHTGLLDSKPSPVIQFHLKLDDAETLTIRNPDREALVKEETSFGEDGNFCIGSSQAADCTVIVGAYPNDVKQLGLINGEDGVRITFQLKSDFLEKGVIRRLRMCFAIVPGVNAQPQLQQLANDFVCSELPLTT